MTHWLIFAAIVTSSWLLPNQSFAQGTDIGISGVGLLSIQPVDDAYVGGPYLNEGIGGVAPGFGAGLSVMTPNGFVVAAEFSRTRFEREQFGRLVGGGFPNEGVPHHTRLHDSLLSGLAGFAHASGDTQITTLGGLSARLDDPTIDGTPREAVESSDDESRALVLTGGVDVLHTLNPRAALLIGARYSNIDRKDNHRYLGIGPHVLRIGAGIRLRLN